MALIDPHSLGNPKDPGQTGRDPWIFFEAVLLIPSSGAQLRELSEIFGKWNSVFRRLHCWMKSDMFYRIFKASALEADFEPPMIDDSIVNVCRPGQVAEIVRT